MCVQTSTCETRYPLPLPKLGCSFVNRDRETLNTRQMPSLCEHQPFATHLRCFRHQRDDSRGTFTGNVIFYWHPKVKQPLSVFSRLPLHHRGFFSARCKFGAPQVGGSGFIINANGPRYPSVSLQDAALHSGQEAIIRVIAPAGWRKSSPEPAAKLLTPSLPSRACCGLGGRAGRAGTGVL